MCSPRRGENKPEDMRREAERMGEGKQVISMNENLERLLVVQERAAVNLAAVTEQVARNTGMLGQGGRYTDEEAAARWESHNAIHAQQMSRINERLAVLEYQAKSK
jgi:hypothetical protein